MLDYKLKDQFTHWAQPCVIIYQPHTAGRENTNAHKQCICSLIQHSLTFRSSYYLSSKVIFTHLHQNLQNTFKSMWTQNSASTTEHTAQKESRCVILTLKKWGIWNVSPHDAEFLQVFKCPLISQVWYYYSLQSNILTDAVTEDKRTLFYPFSCKTVSERFCKN